EGRCDVRLRSRLDRGGVLQGHGRPIRILHLQGEGLESQPRRGVRRVHVLGAPPSGLHRAEEVLEPFARLIGESRTDGDAGDAVEAEVAEIRAHLAPRGERPLLAPEVEAERTHRTLATLAVLVLVAEVEALALDDRFAHRVERLAELAIDVEGGRVKARA